MQTPNYSIWIVKTPILWHTAMVVGDLAHSLQGAFADLGYGHVPIVDDSEAVRGTPIILCGNLLPELGCTIPPDSIIFNLEQVQTGSRWINEDYLSLLRSHRVWDYSQKNLEALHEQGVTDSAYCGIGYHPSLSRLRADQPRDIDVLFYGSPSPRRQKIITDLEQYSDHIVAAHNIYGAELDKLIERAKIVLNVHYYEAKVLEIVRLSYLLANRACIVSENGLDRAIEAPLRQAIALQPYDSLVETCLDLIKDSKRREALANTGFTTFSRMTQSSFLAAALEATEQATLQS